MSGDEHATPAGKNGEILKLDRYGAKDYSPDPTPVRLPGVTLRQYYACEAMKVYLADLLRNPKVPGYEDIEFTREQICQKVRERAFAMADEMCSEDSNGRKSNALD